MAEQYLVLADRIKDSGLHEDDQQMWIRRSYVVQVPIDPNTDPHVFKKALEAPGMPRRRIDTHPSYPYLLARQFDVTGYSHDTVQILVTYSYQRGGYNYNTNWVVDVDAGICNEIVDEDLDGKRLEVEYCAAQVAGWGRPNAAKVFKGSGRTNVEKPYLIISFSKNVALTDGTAVEALAKEYVASVNDGVWRGYEDSTARCDKVKITLHPYEGYGTILVQFSWKPKGWKKVIAYTGENGRTPDNVYRADNNAALNNGFTVKELMPKKNFQTLLDALGGLGDKDQSILGYGTN